MQHELKCWSSAWEAIRDGRKRFEWRYDDRGFEVGDELILKRWDPSQVGYCQPFWPESVLRVRVTYILRGLFRVPEGFCVMSIELIEEDRGGE